MPMNKETFDRVFGKALESMSAEQWYRRHGWRNDVGFRKLPGKSHRVACVICGRHGAGLIGDYSELKGQGLNGWQHACMKPHTDLCACGKAFPTKHALAMHVAANRRHRIDGHGRMDDVGY